jgi:hypothetical protein
MRRQATIVGSYERRNDLEDLLAIPPTCALFGSREATIIADRWWSRLLVVLEGTQLNARARRCTSIWLFCDTDVRY